MKIKIDISLPLLSTQYHKKTDIAMYSLCPSEFSVSPECNMESTTEREIAIRGVGTAALFVGSVICIPFW